MGSCDRWLTTRGPCLSPNQTEERHWLGHIDAPTSTFWMDKVKHKTAFSLTVREGCVCFVYDTPSLLQVYVENRRRIFKSCCCCTLLHKNPNEFQLVHSSRQDRRGDPYCCCYSLPFISHSIGKQLLGASDGEGELEAGRKAGKAHAVLYTHFRCRFVAWLRGEGNVNVIIRLAEGKKRKENLRCVCLFSYLSSLFFIRFSLQHDSSFSLT